MKNFNFGDKVKFTTKDDGNIKFGIEGAVTNNPINLDDWTNSVEVKFKRIGVWTVSKYELKHLQKTKTVVKKKKTLVRQRRTT